jgi:hypothetical protein
MRPPSAQAILPVSLGESTMFSTTGRKRALTDAQIARIMEWQRNRKTLTQVARENNVSSGTVYAVIRDSERYKKSPAPKDSVCPPAPRRRARR